MQRFKLERRFRKAGWWLLKHGGRHDIWTNGKNIEEIPRHPDIKENLARHLIQKHRL